MTYKDSIYKDLPRSPEQLPLNVIKLASRLFAGETGLSGPMIFDFFSNYSEEIGALRYGSGVPSRWMIFENFLESLPIELQRKALTELCDLPLGNPPPETELRRLQAMLRGIPLPATLAKDLQRIDSSFVQKQWEKLTARLPNDPEGAITSARTLLETVCLHILAVRGRKIEYKGDLPQIYKAVAEELSIAPRKEDDAIIRQVLGSCAGLVQGVAVLRNEFGDAHGRLSEETFRHVAHLAANAAGTMAVFLIESMEASGKNKRS
jgi:hypothetical protein